MKRWNLIFGLVFFLLFVLSGQYLRHVFTPEHLDQLVQRTQIRSNHIYLLFIALLNLLASRIEVRPTQQWQSYAAFLFRGLLIGAGGFLLAGFWYEHDGNLQHRQWTRYGLFATLGATVVFLLSEWIADWRLSRK